MMACDKLGAAATAILAATFDDSDYKIEADCNKLISRAQQREYDRVATNFGFKNFEQLLAEIEARTSSRWVYFRFPYSR